MAMEQQQQQKLFSTLMTVSREKLGDFRSKKKKIFMHSGTYQIILYTHFIIMMRGFLFILCVVLTIYCAAADRFQKWQEDGHPAGGPTCFLRFHQQTAASIACHWQEMNKTSPQNSEGKLQGVVVTSRMIPTIVFQVFPCFFFCSWQEMLN